MVLTDCDLPGLFQGADRASVVAQRHYLRGTRLRLGLVIAAAVSGAASFRLGTAEFDAAAAVTVLTLVGALIVEMWLLIENPERTWYDGRALAESAKTIAWRYAVGGLPFPLNTEESAAENSTVQQLQKLLYDAPETKIEPNTAPVVSQAMRGLRGTDLHERKRSYLEGRVADQQQWYANKARWNRTRARYWRITILMAEALGILVALLRAVGVVQIDLVGIVAAMVAAGVAWLAVKQHDSLGRAYAFAAHELGIVHTRLELIHDEETWANEVGDAEEAISREHTMWRASRSTVRVNV